MKILITGGMGFIGSHVAEYYAQDFGNKILIIDNLSRHRNNLFRFDNYENVDFWHSDLIQFDTLNMIIESFLPEIVIHACGQTAVTTSLVDPETDFHTNVEGTFNLLECLRKHNLRPKFLFTSTNKVYGENVNDLQIYETEKEYIFNIKGHVSEKMNIDQTKRTPYGTSKLCADLLVQEYAKSYDIEAVIFRMSCIYGTHQFGIEDQGWIAHFIFQALQDKPITIFGDGKQVRDVLYISDLVEAINRVIKEPFLIEDNVFNVGGGYSNRISLIQLIEMLEDILDKQITIKFAPWRESDQKVYISDISKIRDRFDWRPKVSVRDGVEKTVNWIRKHLKNES
jgi:CDP-paratose 2-epimerase